MSLRGTISDRDAKKKALDLFDEQIEKVKDCIDDLEDAFEEFYENEDCGKACDELIETEAEADRVKEHLLELLFRGTFLPLTAEDRLNLVIMNDNVADAAEKTARVLKAYFPALRRIDKDMKYQIWQLSRKMTELAEHLANSLELLADDFEGAFKEAKMVETMRRDIRHKGFDLIEQLFKEEKNDISIALLTKEIILNLVNVANVAEDTSDFVTAIVIKYSY